MPDHDPKTLVQRLWDFCDVLRDDGLSYGDYLEQLTYEALNATADSDSQN
jgi:type I restriction enzyme M protein